MRIVFMGTPDFAVKSLEGLLAAGHTVSLVVTREDKPRGRGQQMSVSDVKACAITHGVPVYQPRTLRDGEARERIAQEHPDVIVVVAYGRILPEEILSLPPLGCVNVHASLLPRHRGAAPIQWTILSGDREAGVTTMQMDAGLDTGDILMQSKRAVRDTETSGELFDELAEDGAALLLQTLSALERKTATRTPQDPAKATLAPMLDRGYSPLNWERPAEVLHNQVRGLSPWPGATCLFGGKTLKVHVSAVGGPTDAAPGTVVSLAPFAIACGDGRTLLLREVQAEGSRRMNAEDFLRGHPAAVGSQLG